MNKRNVKSSARLLAYQALERIEGDNAYADIVLSHLLERSQLSIRDRAFVSELVRGTVRWKKRLDWIVDQLFSGKADKLPANVRWLLWAGLYQLEYMRTPVFAAVNESVNIARSLKMHRWTGVINGMLRNFARNASDLTFPDPESDPVAWLAVTESYPEWLVKRLIDQIGLEHAIDFCRANNVAPDLTVRPNRSRITLEKLSLNLESSAVKFQLSKVPGFITIPKIEFDYREKLLRDGLMTIQDASAGLPLLLAQPQPGQIIFDLCAAPGGKSMLAADMIGDQGIIISGDKNTARAGLVRQAANRLAQDSVNPVVADALNFPAKQADLVLLDAPCSGLGVMRKKPDLRWKKSESDIAELQALQAKMIRSAGELVKVGGSLVYSTCTIDHDENETIIADFLKEFDNFEIENAGGSNVNDDFITDHGFVRTWPHVHDMDGSFAAKLIKRY
jgi:16S rRNA (cytosine967-C5)-methyltransferase